MDELASCGDVLVIDTNAERLCIDLVMDPRGTSPDALLYLFGVDGSMRTRLDEGLTDDNLEDTGVGRQNEPFIVVECSVIMV